MTALTTSTSSSAWCVSLPVAVLREVDPLRAALPLATASASVEAAPSPEVDALRPFIVTLTGVLALTGPSPEADEPDLLRTSVLLSPSRGVYASPENSRSVIVAPRLRPPRPKLPMGGAKKMVGSTKGVTVSTGRGGGREAAGSCSCSCD